MSIMTYSGPETPKPLVWLSGEIKTPPFSSEARVHAGVLLRKLQEGERLEMPHSRPMPTIGSSCHELRVHDDHQTWRIMYALEGDAVVLLEVFSKKSARTPGRVVSLCRRRLDAFRAL